ncbi:MAG TPA: hypothetical protein VIH93_16905, partial [Thermoanaerobaculia bacterium]
MLPVAYKEVVITRRLSRSGQSDYLLNKANVRLRDIQDLLRGTGLGSDAGVVIEAKMIDLLLSDRAEERRALFEEAAGIGLYRDRKQSTERRLDETAVDLQRVEDLIAEVQTQLRSLARQRGKAERHTKLLEEKFAVQLTLAHRHLDRIEDQLGTFGARRQELSTALPAAREALVQAEHRREETARTRAAVEAERTEIVRRLGAVRVELGKLDGDLALAAERLANAAQRRGRATDERATMEERIHQAARERETAAAERAATLAEHDRIQRELTGRSATEQAVRDRLTAQRTAVRQLEEDLQRHVQTLRSLEGERAALDRDLVAVREQEAQAQARHAGLAAELAVAESRRRDAAENAERQAQAAREAAQAAEQARHDVSEARRREALERSTRRQAEESLAQVSARRQALEELERDRVGLAPGAAALLAVRSRFGDAILGPLSDFISTSQRDADLAERLLGEWVHAVLVRDRAAVSAIQAWHAEAQPGAVVVLPIHPAPPGATGRSIGHGLQVAEPAVGWVHALVAGSEVLDPAGRVLQRPNGAILLTGSTPSGPLRRRADLESLGNEVTEAKRKLGAADDLLAATVRHLAELDTALEHATTAAEEARDAERTAAAAREDVTRVVGNLSRELGESERQAGSLRERLARGERRLAEIDGTFTEGELGRVKQEESLSTGRERLNALEGEQEAAREERVHWQVLEAQVAARSQATTDRLARAEQMGTEAEGQAGALAVELAQLATDAEGVEGQRAQWIELRAERRVGVMELEAAAADIEASAATAERELSVAEAALSTGRALVDSMTEEHHRIEVEATDLTARRRAIAERIES